MRMLWLVGAGAAALALSGCEDQASNAKTSGKPAAARSAARGPQRDWSQVVATTPEGGWRMGSPDAPVKLIEYASFTCTHCRDFHVEGAARLEGDYVKSGKVSYEYRPFPLNVYDIAAVLLARCNGPQAFFGFADAFYRQHDAWTEPFTKITQAQADPATRLPQDQQVKFLADLGNFSAFARARGVPQAKYDRCLTDGAAIQQLTQTQKTAVDTFNVQGTPTFVLNGQKLDNLGRWEQIEPKLKEAIG